MKKSRVITLILCTCILSMVSITSGLAAGNANYNSQGKIIFDNGTEDTADDVIFDSSDFSKIDNMITNGKEKIVEELNKYPSVNYEFTSSLPTFGELASSIDTLTDDADAAGEHILINYSAYVQGAKIDGTMENKGGTIITASIVEEDSDHVVIEVPSAGYYDTTSKISVPVETLKNEVSSLNSRTIISNIVAMGGTCATDANTAEIAAAVLTIPQTINTNNMTGTITYKYHAHEASCYYLCTGTIDCTYQDNDGNGDGEYTRRCNKCGWSHTGLTYYAPYTCNEKIYTCGYSNGQIIGAEITY